MAVFVTHSAEETKTLGKKFAQELPGRIFALIGQLGSGKTTFVKGFAKGLGVEERILSPSFVFIRRYKNRISPRRWRLTTPPRWNTFYHVDLYRLEKPAEIKGLGLEEIWDNPDNIVIIEWAEKIKKILPKKRINIFFEYLKKNQRKITIEQ